MSTEAAGSGTAAVRARSASMDRISASPRVAAGTPAASNGGTPSTEWKLAAWLNSIEAVTQALAASMLSVERPAEQSELEFIRSIGSKFKGDAEAGSAHVLKLLQQSGALKALANAMWGGAEQLVEARAATGAELQAKFLQDNAGLLSFPDLSTFFRGLSGKIGQPDPKVLEAMAREHTGCDDSREEFTTGNYGIKTSSAVEWAFVASPDQEPTGGWPKEEKLLKAQTTPAMERGSNERQLLDSGAQLRKPLPTEELTAKMEGKNERLAALGEEKLVFAEAVAARVYTGPLFVKYNSLLRGLDSDVPFLKSSMIELCCSKIVFDEYIKGALPYTEACKRLNTYTTTLHAINSAIIKLGKLTVAKTVYRGVGSRVLPKEFWEANEFGVKGGIEAAFMSTTLDREVALSYAGGGSGAGFVFEIPQVTLPERPPALPSLPQRVRVLRSDRRCARRRAWSTAARILASSRNIHTRKSAPRPHPSAPVTPPAHRPVPLCPDLSLFACLPDPPVPCAAACHTGSSLPRSPASRCARCACRATFSWSRSP